MMIEQNEENIFYSRTVKAEDLFEILRGGVIELAPAKKGHSIKLTKIEIEYRYVKSD